jgi:hypothetical protein
MEHIKEYAEYRPMEEMPVEPEVRDDNRNQVEDECSELDIRNIESINPQTFMEHLLQAVYILNEEGKLEYLTADKVRKYKLEKAYAGLRLYNYEDYQFSDKYVDIVIDTKTGDFKGRVQLKEQEEERPSMMKRFKSMFKSSKTEVEDINTQVKTYCDAVLLMDQLEGVVMKS